MIALGTAPAGVSEGDATYHAQEREDFVAFLLANTSGKGRCLDIGCAAGRIGAQLKRAGFGEVWGIEPHPVAAKAASEVLDRVIVGTFPECASELEGLFDVVVMADALEHMADPWLALRAVRGILAPGGALVLSVPNVSHLSVALGLLRGRWEYADSGHLDRTHLRFFTPSSIRIALTQEGYVVDAFAASLSRRRIFEMPVVWLLKVLAPHMLVFQIYVVARPESPKGASS